MKKVVRLTESDLTRIVRRIIKENETENETPTWDNMMRDNRILFDKLKAPEKITLQITDEGKEKIKSELLDWIPQNARVPSRITIVDEVTLDRSLHDENMSIRVGEIVLDIGGREVPYFGKYTQDDDEEFGFGKEVSTSRFSVRAEYFPESKKGQLSAVIGLTKGLERRSVKSTMRNLKKMNHCEFSKIEVGETDDRGWFKIISVN